MRARGIEETAIPIEDRAPPPPNDPMRAPPGREPRRARTTALVRSVCNANNDIGEIGFLYIATFLKTTTFLRQEIFTGIKYRQPEVIFAACAR